MRLLHFRGYQLGLGSTKSCKILLGIQSPALVQGDKLLKKGILPKLVGISMQHLLVSFLKERCHKGTELRGSPGRPNGS